MTKPKTSLALKTLINTNYINISNMKWMKQANIKQIYKINKYGIGKYRYLVTLKKVDNIVI